MGCASPEAASVEPTPVKEAAPAIAREQLFFSGRSDDGPVLAALVIQREPRGNGAAVEVKGFVAVGGSSKSPFFERIELAAWPGDEVVPALDAWRESRDGEPVRIEWRDDGASLAASIRTAAASLELTFEGLASAGEGTGPHGPLTWRAGRATLALDGKAVKGVGVVERLRGDVANPTFGSFEMWVVARGDGSLVLGRKSQGAPGVALRVDRSGGAALGPFEVGVTVIRSHEATGFELPTAWVLPTDGGLEVARVRLDEPATGVAASGGPAVYDIGLAGSVDGRSAALVFHLQDG